MQRIIPSPVLQSRIHGFILITLVSKMKVLAALIIVIVATGWAVSSFAVEDEEWLFRQALQNLQRKNFNKSLPVLEDLVRTHPINPSYWFNLGNTYYALGRYDKA